MASPTTETQFPLELLIDSLLQRGEGPAETILNPATGTQLCVVNEASPDQVNRAVSAAHRAFAGWSLTTPGERAGLLLKLADAIEQRAEQFSRLESLNCGKPYARALGDEIPAVADCYRFFAGAPRHPQGPLAGVVATGGGLLFPRSGAPLVAGTSRRDLPVILAALLVMSAVYVLLNLLVDLSYMLFDPRIRY